MWFSTPRRERRSSSKVSLETSHSQLLYAFLDGCRRWKRLRNAMPDSRAPTTALANFHIHSTCGDALDFELSLFTCARSGILKTERKRKRASPEGAICRSRRLICDT